MAPDPGRLRVAKFTDERCRRGEINGAIRSSGESEGPRNTCAAGRLTGCAVGRPAALIQGGGSSETATQQADLRERHRLVGIVPRDWGWRSNRFGLYSIEHATHEGNAPPRKDPEARVDPEDPEDRADSEASQVRARDAPQEDRRVQPEQQEHQGRKGPRATRATRAIPGRRTRMPRTRRSWGAFRSPASHRPVAILSPARSRIGRSFLPAQGSRARSRRSADTTALVRGFRPSASAQETM